MRLPCGLTTVQISVWLCSAFASPSNETCKTTRHSQARMLITSYAEISQWSVGSLIGAKMGGRKLGVRKYKTSNCRKGRRGGGGGGSGGGGDYCAECRCQKTIAWLALPFLFVLFFFFGWVAESRHQIFVVRQCRIQLRTFKSPPTCKLGPFGAKGGADVCPWVEGGA